MIAGIESQISGVVSSAISLTGIAGTIGNLVFPDTYFIGNVAIDTFKDEAHEYNAKVTKYPTERGVTMADHMTIEPAKITIQGEVSDLESMGAENAALIQHPEAIIGAGLSAIGGGSGAVKKSSLIWGQLRAVQSKRELLIIQTNLQIYTDMVITKLQTSQDTDTAGGLRFVATLEEVIAIDFEARDTQGKTLETDGVDNADTADRISSTSSTDSGVLKPSIAEPTSNTVGAGQSAVDAVSTPSATPSTTGGGSSTLFDLANGTGLIE